MSEIPQALVHILHRNDRKAPTVRCTGDTWLVVGTDALIIARSGHPQAGEDSVGAQTSEVLGNSEVEFYVDEEPWYTLQFVRWDARTKQISIKWMDPGRPILELTSQEEDPGYFMTALDERLTHALVVQKQVIADNGTRVTASIRRGPEGLFSAVVADGPLDLAGQELVNRLEAVVREGVGLD